MDGCFGYRLTTPDQIHFGYPLPSSVSLTTLITYTPTIMMRPPSPSLDCQLTAATRSCLDPQSRFHLIATTPKHRMMTQPRPLAPRATAVLARRGSRVPEITKCIRYATVSLPSITIANPILVYMPHVTFAKRIFSGIWMLYLFFLVIECVPD